MSGARRRDSTTRLTRTDRTIQITSHPRMTEKTKRRAVVSTSRAAASPGGGTQPYRRVSAPHRAGVSPEPHRRRYVEGREQFSVGAFEQHRDLFVSPRAHVGPSRAVRRPAVHWQPRGAALRATPPRAAVPLAP
ncbi:hypothetical protein O3G_MSEX014440 [Manduca sexta]|uniref:Uncharacterized protein n=1 Tax=Manduca sexta TaxID=7130 RepID=A0A921ZUQ4_MANSE|nr:hypothetical protein O3G_MSEX014440 [Manduca sexta]